MKRKNKEKCNILSGDEALFTLIEEQLDRNQHPLIRMNTKRRISSFKVIQAIIEKYNYKILYVCDILK